MMEWDYLKQFRPADRLCASTRMHDKRSNMRNFEESLWRHTGTSLNMSLAGLYHEQGLMSKRDILANGQHCRQLNPFAELWTQKGKSKKDLMWYPVGFEPMAKSSAVR